MSVHLPTPIHYWNFDQPSTRAATDSIGGLQAVVEDTAGPWSVPGKWNGAMRFGASAARVVKLRKADGTAAQDLVPPWTTAVWIMRNDATSGSAALLSSTKCGLKVEQWRTERKLGITYFGEKGGDRSIDKVLPAGKWSHLAVVGTANETLFYVDGALAGSVQSSIDLGRDYLGSKSGRADFLEGTIEELRIYDKALTPEQVAELAKLVPVTPPFEKMPLESAIDALTTNAARLGRLIPYAWSISYDLNTENTAISDGGTDMFDVGNILATDIDTLVYSNNTVKRHAAVGPRGSYFTLMLRQLFIAVVDLDGAQSFGTRGLLGAEGGGVSGTVLTTTVEGVRYRGFVKRVYGTEDPSVNHLFIVRDDAGSVSHAFPNDTRKDEHTLTGLPARGRVYYLMFGSRYQRTGVEVGYDKFQALMETFLSVLVEQAKQPA